MSSGVVLRHGNCCDVYVAVPFICCTCSQTVTTENDQPLNLPFTICSPILFYVHFFPPCTNMHSRFPLVRVHWDHGPKTL